MSESTKETASIAADECLAEDLLVERVLPAMLDPTFEGQQLEKLLRQLDPDPYAFEYYDYLESTFNELMRRYLDDADDAAGRAIIAWVRVRGFPQMGDSGEPHQWGAYFLTDTLREQQRDRSSTSVEQRYCDLVRELIAIEPRLMDDQLRQDGSPQGDIFEGSTSLGYEMCWTPYWRSALTLLADLGYDFERCVPGLGGASGRTLMQEVIARSAIGRAETLVDLGVQFNETLESAYSLVFDGSAWPPPDDDPNLPQHFAWVTELQRRQISRKTASAVRTKPRGRPTGL